MLDFAFFVHCFALAVWFGAMQNKLRLLTGVFSAFPHVWMLQTLTLLPPIFTPLCYCVVAELFSASAGLRARTRPQRREVAVESGSSDEEKPAQTAKVPLVASALVIVLLQMAEGFVPLMPMVTYGWFKAFWAGVIFKSLLLGTMIFLAEGLVKSFCAAPGSCCYGPMRCLVERLVALLKLWICSNRIARDMAISAFIYITMLPLVLFNAINMHLCPGWNLHQIFIYRAAYLTTKQRQRLRHKTGMQFSCGADGSGSDTESTSDGYSDDAGRSDQLLGYR